MWKESNKKIYSHAVINDFYAAPLPSFFPWKILGADMSWIYFMDGFYDFLGLKIESAERRVPLQKGYYNSPVLSRGIEMRGHRTLALQEGYFKEAKGFPLNA